MSGIENDCGCCAGTTTETPADIANRPGLPAIAYRAGTWATFKSSLLSRLSSQEFAQLRKLGTRRDDDWTIGLLDAFSVMGDVLTFYQERIANEAFLRTATERRSVLELSRLVGYQLAPGVAASTPLAFTVDVPLTPGAPAPLPVTVPPGTRAQSVPVTDELPQTFETVEPIVARAQWNALGVQAAVRERPYSTQNIAWLRGVQSQLQPGDALAFVSAARAAVAGVGSEEWEVPVLSRVDTFPALDLTRIEWPEASKFTHFAARGAAVNEGVRVFAFRQRAAIFGHNAIDPNQINFTNFPTGSLGALVNGALPGPFTWKNYLTRVAASTIDLEAAYPKIVPTSWLFLASAPPRQRINPADGSVTASFPRTGELYQVVAAQPISRAAFSLAAKVSRLTLDQDEQLDVFPVQGTTVYAQSEELTLADRPLLFPVFGDRVALDSLQPDLVTGQTVAFLGKRARVCAPVKPDGIVFPDTPLRQALPNESFVVMAAPLKIAGGATFALTPADLDDLSLPAGTPLRWSLRDRDGATVTVEAAIELLSMQAPEVRDELIAEVADISEDAGGLSHDLDRTTLKLTRALANVYDRASLRINANVAPATHGETVNEIGGSGVAAASDQRFMLRQSPLTYVSAANPQGRESTLSVRVNDLLWKQTPSLYAQTAAAHVYTLRQTDDGKTVVQFGDGTEGARLPTGQDNVRFNYRKGCAPAPSPRCCCVRSASRAR